MCVSSFGSESESVMFVTDMQHFCSRASFVWSEQAHAGIPVVLCCADAHTG